MTNIELEKHIGKFLSDLERGQNFNEKDVIIFLTQFKDRWKSLSPNMYSQIIICLGEVYKKVESVDEAISFLEEQIGEFESLHPRIRKYKSKMYFRLGCLYAKKTNEQKALKAMQKHIYYVLKDDTSYLGYSFYSFRPCSDYAFQDLRDNTLTVSNPQNFNDYDDCLLFSLIEHLKKNSQDASSKLIVDILAQLYRKIRIRCFIMNVSPKANEEEYNRNKTIVEERYNGLMWAHYADGHKGFCVKYKFPSEVTTSTTDKNDGGFEITRFGDVKYVPSIDITQISNIYDFFFTKSKEWEYEHEVRLLHYDTMWSDDYKPIKLPQGCVKEVYFGIKCSEINKQKIRDALKGETVNYYQIETQDNDLYKLTSKRI